MSTDADKEPRMDRPQEQDEHEEGQALPAADLDEQLDAVSRTVAALREDGPLPQHITVRAADVTVELTWPYGTTPPVAAPTRTPGPAQAPAPDQAPVPAGSAASAGAQEPAAAAPAESGASDQLTINATVVGTFYRSPEPGKPPFVSEGDTVHAGQQVAILEAMKMMLPVEATAAGKVTGFLVEDGSAVEFDTPLITLSGAGG